MVFQQISFALDLLALPHHSDPHRQPRMGLRRGFRFLQTIPQRFDALAALFPWHQLEVITQTHQPRKSTKAIRRCDGRILLQALDRAREKKRSRRQRLGAARILRRRYQRGMRFH